MGARVRDVLASKRKHVRSGAAAKQRRSAWTLQTRNEGLAYSQKNGAQGRNRTTDTAIFSRMLYQLSYLGAAAAQGRSRVGGL